MRFDECKALTRLSNIKATESTHVETVWKLLSRRDISLVPVLSPKNTLVGVIGEDDLLYRLMGMIGEDDIMEYLFKKHLHAIKPKVQAKRKR